MNKTVVGIDIGGSHITAGLVNLKAHAVYNQSIVRNRLNCKGTAEEILSIWVKTIQDVAKAENHTLSRIGLAMPGPFDYENGICLIKGFDKYEALYEMDIRKELADRLQLEPQNILFRNDAEAFLEGELFCGAAKGFTEAIGITLGTGLGSAASHEGVTIDAEMSVTMYGSEIIEESVSTRGLVRNYYGLTGRKLADAMAIAELYPGDKSAQEAFNKFAKDLAWFLQDFINRELPDVLVVGGNIAHSWDLFMPAVKNELAKTTSKLPKIVKAMLGEDAALIGGACCFYTAAEKMSAAVNVPSK